jgi:hypothetical protein
MKNKSIADELTKYLHAGNAHVSLEDALKGLPPDLRGAVPSGLPYSIWQLLDHIRITLWDMAEFCINPDHESPEWPEGYWKKDPNPPSEKAWSDCLKAIQTEKKRFNELLQKDSTELTAALPQGEGQTIFKEALQILDHESYHTAEIVIIRRLLGDWKR